MVQLLCLPSPSPALPAPQPAAPGNSAHYSAEDLGSQASNAGFFSHSGPRRRSRQGTGTLCFHRLSSLGPGILLKQEGPGRSISLWSIFWKPDWIERGWGGNERADLHCMFGSVDFDQGLSGISFCLCTTFYIFLDLRAKRRSCLG